MIISQIIFKTVTFNLVFIPKNKKCIFSILYINTTSIRIGTTKRPKDSYLFLLLFFKGLISLKTSFMGEKVARIKLKLSSNQMDRNEFDNNL